MRAGIARMSRVARLATAFVLVAAIAATAAFGAFSGASKNPGNAVASGTVTIADDDAGGAVVSLADADGGQSATGCIEVHYTGSLPAEVRLTGSATGTLANQLDLTITRGTGASGFPGCGSFSPDATDYLGAGAGVIYSGKLGALPAVWSSAVLDPPGASQETWTTGEKHVYRIRVAVPTDGAAQGLTASTAQLAWEARNQ